MWEVKTGDYTTGEGHTIRPWWRTGKLIVGFTGGDRTGRGAIAAHDAETGEFLWKTYTVPEPGEPGSESWAQSALPPLGGNTWGTISYDPELGRVYLGTGQPKPWATTLRGPGDALYTNCILSLDIDTERSCGTSDRSGRQLGHGYGPREHADRSGDRRSHTQGPRRDQQDRVGPGARPGDRRVLQAFRTGYDNLITGWSDEGRPSINPDLIPTREDVDSGRVFEVCLHLHGTRNLNSPSYSPVTGLYYLGLNNSCMDVIFVTEEYESGGRAWEPSRNGCLITATLASFVAFDPRDRPENVGVSPGRRRRHDRLGTRDGGRPGVRGTANRRLFALDADTGEHLWETRLNGDISGAPVTFEVDGKQYLAVGAGGRIAQTTSYAPLANIDITEGNGVVWVFALP